MHDIKLDGKPFSGPDSWKEVKPAQYLQWVRWQLSGADPAGLFGLFSLWFKLRYWHLIRLDDEFRVTLIDTCLDFIFVRPSVWLLPRLYVFTHRFSGPGDRLQYLTFGEFMFAENVRSVMDDDPTQKQLCELAAALYRPYDSSGEGNRATFNRAGLDRQEKRFAWLKLDTLKGIWINYYGCIDQLPERFTYLFPKQKSGGGGSGGSTWLDTGLSLARQTGALGNFHELEKTNVYLVLTVLDDVMREQAELEKKNKQNGA